MAGWLGKVAAGILGLAGATSCLLQVLSSFFQATSTNIFNTSCFMISYNFQYGVNESEEFMCDLSSLGFLRLCSCCY